MTLTLHYFQSVRQAAGCASESLSFPAGSRVGDLLPVLSNLHPSLAPLFPSLLFAVNQQHARRDTPLRDGDEIALMPPFSGG